MILKFKLSLFPCSQGYYIHGLWPTGNADEEEFKKCEKTQKLKLDPKLSLKMFKIWKPCTRNTSQIVDLWKHEWCKHGYKMLYEDYFSLGLQAYEFVMKKFTKEQLQPCTKNELRISLIYNTETKVWGISMKEKCLKF